MTLISTYKKGIYRIEDIIKERNVLINEKLNIIGPQVAKLSIKKDQDKIFKPFSRIDKSRNKQDGGFGLGLAIVKRVVDLHQGNCQVEYSSL
ncbi:MAG: hypothetical protein HRT40_07140, partial [Campylobacteraceae bacterium]|nr:hypothetical protein [Campylobacteraceae bacterium]